MSSGRAAAARMLLQDLPAAASGMLPRPMDMDPEVGLAKSTPTANPPERLRGTEGVEARMKEGGDGRGSCYPSTVTPNVPGICVGKRFC
eukprot:5503476-Pyramimonas_sp.AAC.1